MVQCLWHPSGDKYWCVSVGRKDTLSVGKMKGVCLEEETVYCFVAVFPDGLCIGIFCN